MKKIFTNGKIYSMNKDREVFDTMVVEDGKIVDILNMKENHFEGEKIDLKGKFIYPGFNDSHLHLLNYGYSKFQADLKGVDSKTDLINRLKTYVSETELVENQWVLGRGWNQDYFKDGKEFPTRWDLDKVSKDIPIAITRACGHMMCLNSKAIEIMGVDKNTSVPSGGQIDLDKEGNPIGLFRENALEIVREHISIPTKDQVKEMILKTIDEMITFGITFVQSDDLSSLPGYSYKEILEIFRELSKEDKLKIRINEQCKLNIEEFKEFLKDGNTTGVGDRFFKIGPLKLFLDGSLGSRTAALREPYSDDENAYGIMTATEEEIDELVEMAFSHNMQVAAHGIGDRAIEMAIKCMSKNRRDDLRNGVIHCQITDMDLLKSFKENEIIAYVQPIFLDYDRNIVWDRVGDRTYTSYNWKTLKDLGVHVSFGTDSPVEHFNPFHNIYEAVTRKDLKGLPEEGFLIDQAMSVDECIRAYTYEGAYAAHMEDEVGTLEKGKYADFIVMDEDLYKVDPMDIKDLRVEKTFIEGKEVFSR